MSEPVKWEPGTTLRLTRHLWKTVYGRYAVLLESKCGLCRSEIEIEPTMPGDRICRRCFPSERQHGDA